MHQLLIACWLAIAPCQMIGSASPLSFSKQGDWKRGSERIEELEASYQKGKHDQFLSDIHQRYLVESEKGGKLDQFLTSEELETKSVIEEEAENQQFQDKILSLQEQRNEQLKEIAAKYPNAKISKVIKQLEENKELSDSFEEHFLFIANMEKDTKEETDPMAVQVKAIAKEFHLKTLLIDFDQINGKIDAKTAVEQKFVLEREKIKQMVAVCYEDCNSQVATKVKEAEQGLKIWTVTNINLETLRGLRSGTIKAKSAAEKKVKQVLVDYQTELQAAIRQHMQVVKAEES